MNHAKTNALRLLEAEGIAFVPFEYDVSDDRIDAVAVAEKLGAPPEQVFALINDFHRWGEWSPWEKLDPAMNRTFGGPAGSTATSTAELRLIGEPTYTWATVTP